VESHPLAARRRSTGSNDLNSPYEANPIHNAYPCAAPLPKRLAERVAIPPEPSWSASICRRRFQLEYAGCMLPTVLCGSQSKALNVPTHLVDFNAILLVGSVLEAEVRAFFTEKIQPAIKSIRPVWHAGSDCGPPCQRAE